MVCGFSMVRKIIEVEDLQIVTEQMDEKKKEQKRLS